MKITYLKATIVLFFLLLSVLTHNTVAGTVNEHLNQRIHTNIKTDAIVKILTFEKKNKRFHVATGFVVSSDGIIITNYHTLVNINSIEIRLSNDKKLRFEGILGVDRQ